MQFLSHKYYLSSRYFLAIILYAWLIAHVGMIDAQNAPRDYAIERAQVSLSADELYINITVDIVNNGGDAVRDTDVSVVNVSDGGRVVAEDTLSILSSDERTSLTFELITADFTPSSVLVLRIEAGVDLYELAGTAIAEDNTQEVSVTIPATVRRPPEGSTNNSGSAPDDGTNTTQASIITFNDDGSITFNGTTYSRDDLLLAGGIGVVVLMLLWLVTVILRLIFRRPPTFGNWQPPYATVPALHPDTVAGRRQAWQQHVQNSLILAPPHEGTPYAVKNLLGRDGSWLTGWQVVGLRCAQYDQYGRVTRTQFIGTHKLLKQINRIMPAHGTPKFEKRIQQVTKAIRKGAQKSFGKKTLFLPVSIDLRWEGDAHDVRIQFQLYQAQQGRWALLDEWDPQMAIMPPRFQEQTTYTIHGQTAGEKPKDYYARLERDLGWLLAQTFHPHTPDIASSESSGTNEENAPTSVPAYDVPDTLSNMKPVDDAGTPPEV
jgi:hypothetical protein